MWVLLGIVLIYYSCGFLRNLLWIPVKRWMWFGCWLSKNWMLYEHVTLGLYSNATHLVCLPVDHVLSVVWSQLPVIWIPRNNSYWNLEMMEQTNLHVIISGERFNTTCRICLCDLSGETESFSVNGFLNQQNDVTIREIVCKYTTIMVSIHVFI